MATEAEVVAALRERYMRAPRNGTAAQWVFVGQISVGASFGLLPHYPWEEEIFQADPRLFGGQHRMDAFAINCYRGKQFERHAFEVKCSRSDLMSELKNPTKRDTAMALSNKFFFVLDSTVNYDPEDIPADCGIMIHTNGKIRQVRDAPWRAAHALPWRFVVSLLRTVQKEGSDGG